MPQIIMYILNEDLGEQEYLENQLEAIEPNVETFAERLATEDLDEPISLDDLPM